MAGTIRNGLTIAQKFVVNGVMQDVIVSDGSQLCHYADGWSDERVAYVAEKKLGVPVTSHNAAGVRRQLHGNLTITPPPWTRPEDYPAITYQPEPTVVDVEVKVDATIAMELLSELEAKFSRLEEAVMELKQQNHGLIDMLGKVGRFMNRHAQKAGGEV